MTQDDLLCSPASMAAAPATGVARLRLHTAARHRALEATPLARALLSPALDRAGYRRVLAAWVSAMSPLEQALQASPHAAALGDLVPPPRRALAVADLRALAAAAREPAAIPLARAPAQALLAATATPAGLLGLCYVLRGASLGSQVIARHLREHLGLDAAHGARYFGQAPSDMPGWPRWMATADAWLAAAGGAAADATRLACLGADAAFDTLLAAFAAVPLSQVASAVPAATSDQPDRTTAHALP